MPRPTIGRLLSRRHAVAAVIALAVCLQAPSVSTGFVADDHLQRIIARPHDDRGLVGLPPSRLDLFTFAGKADDTRLLMDQGLFPWTADPEVRLAFFRPISSLSHALDARLWPDSAALAHLHNLLWLALALGAVWVFYRRFLGRGVDSPAALALLLYAVDDARGPAVGWIANRNAFCALAIALPAVVLHDRFRKDGWRPGAVLAPLVLACGLLAGESALATAAYLAAYALHLDRGRPAARLASLLPYAAVVLGWIVLYQALGYGASGSGVYLDPARDPRAFLHALPSRMALLLLGQFGLPWSDFAEFYAYLSPRLTLLVTLFAAGALALLGWALLPLWRRSAEARFFATSALLAAVPICATFPADRLLSFVGLGGMGLIALYLARPRVGAGRRLVGGLLIAIHLVLAPPFAALRSRSMVTVARPLAHANDTLPKGSDLGRKTLVIVNPPSDILVGYVQIMRASLNEPRPERLRWLASGNSPVRVERPDARTLVVRPERGFIENVPERMLRSARRPLTAGDRVLLTGMTAEVLRLLPDGRPAEVRFTFDLPLEDPHLVWSAWQKDGYAPWQPPPVSGHTTLPASDFFRAMFPPPG